MAHYQLQLAIVDERCHVPDSGYNVIGTIIISVRIYTCTGLRLYSCIYLPLIYNNDYIYNTYI